MPSYFLTVRFPRAALTEHTQLQAERELFGPDCPPETHEEEARVFYETDSGIVADELLRSFRESGWHDLWPGSMSPLEVLRRDEAGRSSSAYCPARDWPAAVFSRINGSEFSVGKRVVFRREIESLKRLVEYRLGCESIEYLLETDYPVHDRMAQFLAEEYYHAQQSEPLIRAELAAAGKEKGFYLWWTWGEVHPEDPTADLEERFYFYRTPSQEMATRLCSAFGANHGIDFQFDYTASESLHLDEVPRADDMLQKYRKREVTGVDADFFWQARQWEAWGFGDWKPPPPTKEPADDGDNPVTDDGSDRITSSGQRRGDVLQDQPSDPKCRPRDIVAKLQKWLSARVTLDSRKTQDGKSLPINALNVGWALSGCYPLVLGLEFRGDGVLAARLERLVDSVMNSAKRLDKVIADDQLTGDEGFQEACLARDELEGAARQLMEWLQSLDARAESTDAAAVVGPGAKAKAGADGQVQSVSTEQSGPGPRVHSEQPSLQGGQQSLSELLSDANCCLMIISDMRIKVDAMESAGAEGIWDNDGGQLDFADRSVESRYRTAVSDFQGREKELIGPLERVLDWGAAVGVDVPDKPYVFDKRWPWGMRADEFEMAVRDVIAQITVMMAQSEAKVGTRTNTGAKRRAKKQRPKSSPGKRATRKVEPAGPAVVLGQPGTTCRVFGEEGSSAESVGEGIGVRLRVGLCCPPIAPAG